ncbi:MAG: hypothetical protein NXI10_10455 [bacterium]|nr:hypothetical protein [bacterium]
MKTEEKQLHLEELLNDLNSQFSPTDILEVQEKPQFDPSNVKGMPPNDIADIVWKAVMYELNDKAPGPFDSMEEYSSYVANLCEKTAKGSIVGTWTVASVIISETNPHVGLSMNSMSGAYLSPVSKSIVKYPFPMFKLIRTSYLQGIFVLDHK